MLTKSGRFFYKSERGNNPGDELRLVKKIRGGDAGSFELLFRKYYGDMCGFVNSFPVTAPDSEDIVQNIFLNIWNNRANWSPGISLKSYLFRAAKNGALNRMKHLSVERNYAEREWQSGPWLVENIENELDRKEFLSLINMAVSRLPEKCRTIFLMRSREELTYREISEVLGISENTVATQVGRAIRKLNKLLFCNQPFNSD